MLDMQGLEIWMITSVLFERDHNSEGDIPGQLRVLPSNAKLFEANVG